MSLFTTFSSLNCCKHLDILRWKPSRGKKDKFICRKCGAIISEINISEQAEIENISNKLILKNASNICKLFGTKINFNIGTAYQFLPKKKYKMKEYNDAKRRKDQKINISC